MSFESLNKKLLYELIVDENFKIQIFSLNEKENVYERKKILKRCLTSCLRAEDQFDFLDNLAKSNDLLSKFSAPFVEDGFFHIISIHQGIRLDYAIKECQQQFLQDNAELKIFLQLLNAANYLHKNSILHSQINTQNIYLKNEFYEIELGGLHFLERIDNSNKELTKYEHRSLHYKCPEAKIGFKYDIWCIGWVFYEICTGVCYKDQLDLLSLCSFENWTPPQILSEDNNCLFKNCISKNASTRLSIENMIDTSLLIQALRNQYIEKMINKVVVNENTTNEYKIIEFLGNGTFSSIFVALDLKNMRKCAIKLNSDCLDSKTIPKVLEEARILHDINHPNIIKFYEYFLIKETNKIFIITEYYPEGNLKTFLTESKAAAASAASASGQQKQKLSINLQIEWSYQLLKGLRHLHSINIIHRDIKPSNIMLSDQKSTLKIGHFGKAKQANCTQQHFITDCGTYGGYEAPEISLSLNPSYTNKIDVWSLGCVIYEIVTLDPAFEQKNLFEIARCVDSSFKPPKLSPIDQDQHVLQCLIDKMLLFDPDHRDSSRNLFKEIKAIKEEHSIVRDISNLMKDMKCTD